MVESPPRWNTVEFTRLKVKLTAKSDMVSLLVRLESDPFLELQCELDPSTLSEIAAGPDGGTLFYGDFWLRVPVPVSCQVVEALVHKGFLPHV